MSLKAREAESRIKVQEALPIPRSGGETRPYEYPHLYQIQAGDWRISYAVEQNHLAILVLEVLNPDGTVRKDPARETMTRKMKVKLLDWPEGSPSRDLPPEDLGKKVKIRLLDLADELQGDNASQPRAGGRIRLQGTGMGSGRSSRITLRDAAAEPDGDSSARPTGAEADMPRGRKTTPLDSPTM
jgi:mRNA-degrading endonuclease RelE of RelBE toxin-antitoxin system